MIQTEDEDADFTAARQAVIDQGPCGICGGPYAAHRMIDTQMGCVAAGDSPDKVAENYGVTVEAMVLSWMAYIDLLEHPPEPDPANDRLTIVVGLPQHFGKVTALLDTLGRQWPDAVMSGPYIEIPVDDAHR